MKLKALICKHKHQSVLAIMVVIYIIYFTTFTFLKHDNFYTGRFDLGNMDQTVWNTINGRIFQMTDPDGINTISRLAFHSDFILILISPFYLIWSDPKTLLFIQTTILAIGAVFIYLLANLVLKNKNISLAFAFGFLINPAVQYTNLYDFHAVTLATTFLLATFYFLIKKRLFLFIVFGVLSVLTKEQVWLIFALFGLFVLARRLLDQGVSLEKKLRSKELISGSIIFISSLLIFYFLINNAIPVSRGDKHFALSYYSEFGDSPTKIIKNIFFSPIKTSETLMQKEKIDYLNQIFKPLGYLPVIYPAFIVFTLPDFIINLFSNNKNLYKIYYQYTATITPFLFISSIYAIKFIKNRYHAIPINFFIIYIVFFAMYGQFEIGSMPWSKNPQLDMFTRQYQNRDFINSYLAKISEKYSVAATNNIGAHLSQRENIYTIPVGLYDADYVIFLLNDPSAQPSLPAQKEMAKNLKENIKYELLIEKGDFVAFKKREL